MPATSRRSKRGISEVKLNVAMMDAVADMVLDRSVAKKPAEISFFDIIEKHGWHVMSVANAADESGPFFSYSTGIYQKLRAPELLIIGLSSNLSARLINIYGNNILNQGAFFEAGKFYSGFLEGFDVYMTEPDDRARKEFAIWADWYYQRQPFPILQCIWPSTNGVWPWEEAASVELKEMQPLLGSAPPWSRPN